MPSSADIAALIDALPSVVVEREALAMRWGLDGHDRPHTVDEIADTLALPLREVIDVLGWGVDFASSTTRPPT